MKMRALCAALVLLLTGFSFAGTAGRALSSRSVPWTFHADFAHGLNGWMSFPLAQDIGFDPSLYTAAEGLRTVLVRQVQTLGEKRLTMGVIRPVRLFAASGIRIHLEYSLSFEGGIAIMEIILAGANRRRYSASLPRVQGRHTVSVSDSQLNLPAHGIDVQAVILLSTVDHPVRNGTQKLTVSDFSIHAERQPEVAIFSPALERSDVSAEKVSGQVLGPDSGLRLQLEKTAATAEIEADNPTGQRTIEMTIRPSVNPVAVLPLGPNPPPGLWTAKITSGPAQTSFKFLVLRGTPPHPRILLREKRLEQLRGLPQYAELRRQIHRRAQAFSTQIAYNPAAGSNIAHLPGGTGLVPGFVGELKSYFNLLESCADAISYCALDYSVNGNQKSFESARRALLAVARWQTWTPPRFATHGLHTYYEVGVFSQRVAFGYDLIAPRLTAEEKVLIAEAFWEQVIKPTVNEYFLYNRMPTAASNWMANSLGEAIAAAVADEGDVPEWKSREGVALAELDDAFEHLLKGLFPGDGSEAEPAGYENFAMQGLSWGMAALDSPGIRPLGTGRMWNGFWWPYYAMVRPDLVLDTGDFDGKLEKLSGFAWAAEHAGIPALRDFYGRSPTHVSFSEEPRVQHTGRRIEDEAGPLDLACCSSQHQAYTLPPPSRIFPDRGSAVLRSGWDNQATVISLRAGPWFNHEHHDEGSFQVAAFGEKLISEAGYSAYYNDPNYRVYFTQASGHNTVLIDDDPFSQAAYNGNFWRAFDRHPHFGPQLLSSGFDYLAADLASAYAGRLSRYERDFVFIPPEFLVIYDRLASNTPHVYTWLLHAPTGADLSTESAHAVIQMPNAAASLLAAGPASEWKVKSTPIPITEFDDLDHGEIHTLREFYLQSSKVREATFLVGLRFQRGRGSDSSTPIRSFSSPAGEGIQLVPHTAGGVVFRTGSGRLQLDGLTTDGAMLAVRGNAASRSWLAAGARVVEQGHVVLLRSDMPVVASMRQEGRGIELNLHSPSVANIEVAGATPPSSVRIDGAPARFEFHAGMVMIRDLKKGDHRVSIDE